MSIRKMKQVLIGKVNLSGGFIHKKTGSFLEISPIFMNNDGFIELKKSPNKLAISESIFTRNFNEQLENFIVFEFQQFNEKMLPQEKEIVEMIFEHGIIVEGSLFRPFVQSSSQNRNNELIFTCLKDRVKVLSQLMAIDLTNHLKFNVTACKGEEVVINKFMSRAGMTLANGLATNVFLRKNNYTVIYDLQKQLKVQGKIYDYDLQNNKLFTIDENINHPVTDGQNYISMIMAAKISKSIGLISISDYKYFRKHWKGMISLKDEKLKTIFDKFYKIMQLRAPGVKGLFIAIDFYSLREKMNLNIVNGYNKMNDDIHFILGAGGLKYVPDHSVEFQYMQGNKEKRLSSTLSIQTLNSLNLSIEDSKILTDQTIDMFNNVLKDVDYALEFLGTYFPTDFDAESIDEVLVTKVHKALLANSETIKERWVQKALTNKLLGKRNKEGQLIEVGALQRAKFGKLPVKGNFFFVITDPYAHLGLSETLKSSEIHFNNFDNQEVSLFRYPNVHPSEIVRANAVSISVYDYLENVIIMNPIDDTLPRMAGGDTDGDMLLIVFDDVIIKNTPKTHQLLPYGEGAQSLKTDLTMKNYDFKLMKSIFDDSKIGQITNNATIFRDFENSLNIKGKKVELAADYNEKVLQLRFLQGYEIDKAKTGVKVVVDKKLEPKFIPTWFMRYLYEIKRVSAAYLKETYSKVNDWDLVLESESALSYIYRRFKNYEDELKQNVTKINKESFLKGFVQHLISNKDFDPNKSKSIYKNIEILEKDYRKELAIALNHNNKETSKYHVELVFNKYQKFINSIDANDITKLYVAYTVVMNRENNSDSFYRTFCFDALLKTYEEMAFQKTILIKVDDLVKKVTVRGEKVYFDGELTNNTYNLLKGVRKAYKTFTLKNGTYIRTLLKKDVMITDYISKKELKVSMSLTVLGLQYNSFKEMNSNQMKSILSEKNLTLNKIFYKNEERIALFAEDLVVGLLPKTIKNYAEQYLGFQLSYVDSIISITREDLVKTLELEFLFGERVVDINEIETDKKLNKINNGPIKIQGRIM